MEAFQDAAEELGCQKIIAHALTLQTVLGAARLAIESDKDLIDLRKTCHFTWRHYRKSAFCVRTKQYTKYFQTNINGC